MSNRNLLTMNARFWSLQIISFDFFISNNEHLHVTDGIYWSLEMYLCGFYCILKDISISNGEILW